VGKIEDLFAALVYHIPAAAVTAMRLALPEGAE